PNEVARRINAQQAGHPSACVLVCLLELCQNGQAATVVLPAFDGWLNMARRALQQAHAEPPFQILDCSRSDGSGDAEIGSARAETGALNDPYEQLKGGKPVHADYSVFQNSIVGKLDLIPTVGCNY